MDSKRVKLRDFIALYDEINVKNEFTSLDDLQGINNEKYFQECQSNKNEIDLSRYRICRSGMFAYNKATSRNGEKISIAYREGKDCLVSPSYICFKIKDENVLLHEYLMLLFKRPVFDRYVRFHSWGSATEFFTFDDMCNVEIVLPSLEKQKLIVNQCKTFSERIDWINKVNALLEKKVFLRFLKLVEGKEKNSVLSNIATIIMGSSPSGEALNVNGKGMVFYQGKTDFGFRFPSVRCFTTDVSRKAKKGDILMSVRAPVGDINIAVEDCCIGRGIAAIRPKGAHKSFLFYTMKKLYYELQEFNDKGTVFGSINKDELFTLPIFIPENGEIEELEHFAQPIDSLIECFEAEKAKLSLLLAGIYASLD